MLGSMQGMHLCRTVLEGAFVGGVDAVNHSVPERMIVVAQTKAIHGSSCLVDLVEKTPEGSHLGEVDRVSVRHAGNVDGGQCILKMRHHIHQFLSRLRSTTAGGVGRPAIEQRLV
jgi:hypothetical protein